MLYASNGQQHHANSELPQIDPEHARCRVSGTTDRHAIQTNTYTQYTTQSQRTSARIECLASDLVNYFKTQVVKNVPDSHGSKFQFPVTLPVVIAVDSQWSIQEAESIQSFPVITSLSIASAQSLWSPR
jgi:hypothetical protein